MKTILCSLLLAIAITVAPAAAYEWEIDPAHSAIMFEIKHIYSVTRGQFTDFSGSVSFDPKSPEKSACEFVVQVDSINTRISKRDNHLRSGDFFAADDYPEMVFRSTKVTPAGEGQYVLEGKMTVRDVTRDMRLQFVFLGEKEHPLQKGKMVGGFETRFRIDRLAFNVGGGKFYEMGVVDKDVDVLISLEMLRDK